MNRLIILFLFFHACSSVKQEVIVHSASSLVVDKINIIKTQLVRYSNGKPADFSLVNEIVNLSNIEPKEIEGGGWRGIIYIPDYMDIEKWNIWYKNNENNFYLNPKNECLITEFHLTEKERNNVVFLKIDETHVRSNLYYDMIGLCSDNTKVQR